MDCVTFLQDILPRLRMRWPGFRKVRGQVCKRISRRFRELGLTSLADYSLYLDSHPDEWAFLDRLCRVTISRFCRDRGVFDQIRDAVLPEVAAAAVEQGRDTVRVWSCGCASGEEAYSISLCYRLGPAGTTGVRLQVVGTDTDDVLLTRAGDGIFPIGALKELPIGWLEVAFEPVGDQWRIMSCIQNGVSWVSQDIREGAPAGPFDLVLCRNLVFTYFARDLQVECLTRLLGQLRPGGYLVLGKHESLPGDKEMLEQVDKSGRIFRRSS